MSNCHHLTSTAATPPNAPFGRSKPLGGGTLLRRPKFSHESVGSPAASSHPDPQLPLILSPSLQLSSYAHVHGMFDYNQTPLAPPGIRVLVHNKPSVRGTWAPHALPGWYIHPAMQNTAASTSTSGPYRP
jgi:hypothetical protein